MLALAVSAAGHVQGAASLRLADTAPLVLRGAGFKPREQVRIVVKAGADRRSRTVSANSAGRFLVRFRALGHHPCDGGLVATATGSFGSHARLKLLPQPLCPPRG